MRCVDSDFLIDVLNDEPRVRDLVKQLDGKKEYFTTTISVFELMAGAYQLGKVKLEAAQLLLSRFHIFEFNQFAADEAARIYADLRKKGKEIPMRDAMIAGIAKVNGCSLITRDTSHFKRVPSLKVITW
ncbi:MAG: type II toxin-antitoxin system VapC family toxin [Methanomassiliicoccales archaeon]|nr:MAG: type II toxin-antitoxin system VapC family toxin [Methanomassiliicoccales archaeon]